MQGRPVKILIACGSGIATSTLAAQGAVSYTHLDVYKRQVK